MIEKFDTNGDALFTLVENLMTNKDITRIVGPRGLKTIEFNMPLTFQVNNPQKRIMSFRHIGCNPIFPYIEGLWMLLGEENPARLLDYSKFPAQFINDKTGNLDGAYGPRMRHIGPLQRYDCSFAPIGYVDQLQTAYQCLVNDPNSRRAIVTLSNPILDWNIHSLDRPCTESFHFMIRDGKLNMVAKMRSQDIIRGFPNDLCEFQWFQEIMAGWLDVPVGTYIHVIDSLHIYETEWKYAREMLAEESKYRLYNHVKPIDCKMNFADFDALIKLIGYLEREIVKSPIAVSKNIMEEEEYYNKVFPEFYRRLLNVILANRFYKIGWLDDAIDLVKDQKSDLEYYYHQRWNRG